MAIEQGDSALSRGARRNPISGMLHLATGSALTAALAAIIGWAAYTTFLHIVAQPTQPYFPPPFVGYASTSMQQSITVHEVAAEQEQILSRGSRFLGEPGFYETEDALREIFTDYGLELFEQEISSVAPKTRYREVYLLGAGGSDNTGLGQLLPQVEIYPFLPNYLQPVVTPEQGLAGELVPMTTEIINSRRNFDNCIGLINAEEDGFDPSYGFRWSRYAQLGIKAIIIAHPMGLDRVAWNEIANRESGLVSSVPINYVRVAASREIFNYIGSQIRLRVRVDFESVPSRTLIARMRAETPARDALILLSSYGASSILPDLAPGGIQAISTATQIQLLKGLANYRRSMTRDIIFVATGARFMAEDGSNNLIRILQINRTQGSLRARKDNGEERETDTLASLKTNQRNIPLEEELDGHEERLAAIKLVRTLLEDPKYLLDAAATRAALEAMPRSVRNFFEEQFAYLVDSIIKERAEPEITARLEFMRDSDQSTTSPSFRHYQSARRQLREAEAASGFQPANLLESKPGFVRGTNLRQRVSDRFEELNAYHRTRVRRIGEELEIVAMFSAYNDIGVIEDKLVPAISPEGKGETLGMGPGVIYLEPEALGIHRLAVLSRDRIGINDALEIPGLAQTQYQRVQQSIGHIPNYSGRMWGEYGYPHYTFYNFRRRAAYDRYNYPVVLPFMKDLRSIENTLAVFGETVLSMAHGNGSLVPTIPESSAQRSFAGKVLASGIGSSIVPKFPLSSAIIACRKNPNEESFGYPGYYKHLIVMTDPYGRFNLPHNSSDFAVYRSLGLNPVAAAFDDAGLINFIKDEGEEGQRRAKSVGIDEKNPTALKNLTIATFRAAPVAILDLINPQTLTDYTAVQMISAQGWTELPKQCRFRDASIDLTYLSPEQRVFVQLQSGTPANELLRVTRAFSLGRSVEVPAVPDREIDGQGYLVGDQPMLVSSTFDIARSMASVNGYRLALQERFSMADERTIGLHKKTLTRIDASHGPGLSAVEAKREARKAVVFATINHPVLRQTVFESIFGVLWYLALLVPFVFFFEKLVFCFPDIRKQLVSQAAIFLVVFGLLRILHPAFSMVRSSFMILLGFVIILITLGLTIIFSSKFGENLEGLRRRQGRVSGAGVSPLGVAGSAFLLGLNNMHRRPLRTGLTCGTLTLLTFAMICFASVDNDLVDEEYAVGKAPFQGILIKKPLMGPISDSEVIAVSDNFAARFALSPRKVHVGIEDEKTKSLDNPALEMTYKKNGSLRRVPFESVLQFTHSEPLRELIVFTSERRWFTREDEQTSDSGFPIIIPDAIARKLGVTAREIDAGEVVVNVGGRECRVIGIFEANSVNRLRDLDGGDILPFDIERMEVLLRVKRGDTKIAAADDDPRILAENLIIAPMRSLNLGIANTEVRTVSVAVAMPELGYRDARQEIRDFLEQTGEPGFYGVDDVAYKGRRTRDRSIAGVVDLIIPLLIAAFTVLNTMKGSVYERKSEIYVYNAVGIAPRYVFFIFFSEAMVYVVVGSVLGYLLSQGTGRILTEMGWTGGTTMAFSSISTIYASLALSGAVIVSTWIPARTAMEISAPAEEAGWELPEPDGDRLIFDLPFNFRPQGRVAVLAFLHRYLLDHGEGSSGKFYAGGPIVAASLEEGSIASGERDREPRVIPRITVTIWLKPFDLAVSQHLTIHLPRDPDTGLYKACVTIVRLSGTRESWLRLNNGFVGLIRRHFLHWRAVTREERKEMLAEAGELMRNSA